MVQGVEKSHELEHFEEESPIAMLLRVLASVISLCFLISIIYWSVKLYERDIEDLPVIAALTEEPRVKPDDTGGEKINFQGFSVNNVLGEQVKNLHNEDIRIATESDNISSQELSPIIDVPSESGSDLESMSEAISQALEDILGAKVQKMNNPEEEIELQIGTFSEADKANAHWFFLKQANVNLLARHDYRIVETNVNGERLYRLRITGFESAFNAKDLCEKLTRQGEKCVAAIKE